MREKIRERRKESYVLDSWMDGEKDAENKGERESWTKRGKN